MLLRWKSTAEKNNLGYEIYRARTAGAWERIGFVEGAGNSSFAREYEYTDRLDMASEADARLYYRLKQLDFDGNAEYSPVVEVNLASPPLMLSLEQVYPNPVVKEGWIRFTVDRKSELRISLHDAAGREALRLRNSTEYGPGAHTLVFDASVLPAGAYYLRLSSGDAVETRAVMIAR